MKILPENRLRRLRINPTIRSLVRETSYCISDLIYPIFVDETISEPREIASMPGVIAYPLEMIAEETASLQDLGINAILLFGIPAHKDEQGSGAWVKDGIVQKATRAIKEISNMTVITDLCLCEYTSHGHCGVLAGEIVDNDPTIELYAQTAVSQAAAGADMVAPSGMMDGQVAAMRTALDDNGFLNTPIMAYSAKYASAFYGPFREAADSTPSFGDRRTHQMDPANLREAFREMEADLREGADILMVKPAMPYLDVIREARVRYEVPIAAYQVSGEYAMIVAAAQNGWLDRQRAIQESIMAIKRAGADMIITYFAKEIAEGINEL
ncbi:porphobilinogen synthase [Candidatus Methanomassiliicoccus intestinalis]|uniref:porphobilinogen synthase n=1 Tax=Candidatus Methanomassiliicoccus intestinalis TaxID=1406512 RepID=UPI0037DC1C8D